MKRQKKLEAAAVPAEQGVGFENQEGLSPRLKAAGKEQQRETFAAVEAWLVDLALEDEELLAQQCILENEVGFRTGEVIDKG